jgi:hypothetical protein
MVMRLLLAVLMSAAALALSAKADDVPGRRSFEEGVAAAAEQHWQAACQHFEASLAEADKPATRFNLILANHELQRPLEVVRHALAFLAYPEQPEHAAAKARARELLELVTKQLAVLTTDSLPESAELSVDGAAPSVKEQHRVYVAPGLHHLEARLGRELFEAIEIHLAAGQVTPWPRQGRSRSTPRVVQLTPPSPPAALVLELAAPPPSPPLRTRLAWTMGSMGAAIQLSALGAYLGTLHRANEFMRRDLFEPGVERTRDRYLRLQRAIAPLALVGGALMASAVAVGARSTRAGSLAWPISALVAGSAMLGAGLALVLREPARLQGGDLREPTRQGSSLLAAGALPLFTYGIGCLHVRKRARPGRNLAALPLAAVW